MCDKKDSTTVTSEQIAIGEMSGGEIHYHSGKNSQTTEDIKKLEAAYLDRLMQDCGALDWLRSVRYQDDNALQERMARNARQLSAVEVLNQQQYLVLTGAPRRWKKRFC